MKPELQILKRGMLTCILFMLMGISFVQAQTVITIGTGTTTNATNTQPTPYGAWFSQSKMQLLILASELNTLGYGSQSTISTLAFNVITQNASGSHNNYTIKMKNTTVSVLSTAWDNAGLTQVYTTAAYVPVSGWNTHTFQTPFTWDGTSNLLIDLCHDNGNNSFTASPAVANTVTSFNSVIQAWDDNSTGVMCPIGNAGTNYTNRPNMQMTILSSGVALPPIANFYTPDTVWINSPQTILNTSSFQSRVFWNLPDENPLYPGYNRTTAGIYAGYIDTAKYSNHFTYTFTSPGLKRVKLLAVNNYKRDSLLDSIVKFIYVDTPSQKPKADFISFKRKLGFGEEAPLLDLSTNGPNQWEWSFDPPCATCATDPNAFPNYFNPSNTISNPRFAAFDPGVFRVCLRVWNNRGTDSICKPSYVQVFTGINMCAGTSYQSSEPIGFLYGVSGPYTSYARSLWSPSCPGFTIAPCADSVTLYIERIKMLPGDSIEIFNGPNTATSPRLTAVGASTTGQLPLSPAQSIIRGGSSLSFKYKPGSATIPGGYDSATFSFRWEAKPASYSKPTASFNIPDTFYSNQPVSYVNTSTGTLMKYSWDTDGNGLFDSTSANPTRTFLVTTPLSRVITMVAYNCVGSDTIRKTVTFLPINRIPIARFTADKFLGFNTDTFKLIDQSVYGVTQWNWIFSPNAVQFINGTSANSQNPQVRLTSPVAYTIRLVTTNNFGVDSVTKTAFIQVSAYQTPGSGTVFSSVADATMGIRRVRLSSVDSTFTNFTGPTYQYINTTTQLANVNRGGKYAIVINRPSAGTNMDYKVWIDLNFNANFESNELVLNKINNGDAQLIDTIVISPTQGYGTTRMRVGTDLANSTQFNSVYSVIGMFKDFNVAINKDNVKPVISLLGNNIVRTEINKTFNDPWVLATDNIEGNIAGRVQIVSTLDTSNLGVYTIKYFVKDYSGNVSDTLIRTVIVELNNTGPAIALLGGSTVRTNVKTPFVDPGVIALDNTGADISANVVKTTDLNENVIGTYTTRYTITDAFSFTKFVDRTIIVQDTIKPVIIAKGIPYLHQVLTNFEPLEAINWSDNYNSKAQLTPTYVGVVNPNLIGTYYVVYDLVDESGNAAAQLRLEVNVTDKIKPSITLNGASPLEIEVNEVYNDPGVGVSDNYWPVNNLYLTKTTDLRIDSLGTYTQIYTVTDGSGNVEFITRTIIVKDGKAPTISLLGATTVNLIRWSVFNDPGVQISDNYNTDAQIRKNLTIVSNLPQNGNGDYFGDVEGLFSVSYKVTDLSGNQSAPTIRTVNVVANSSSVEDVLNANNIVAIYPNPSNGLLKLKLFEALTDDVNIKVYNAVGGLAKTITINKNDLVEKQIDLSAFANGVYLIQVETNNKVYTHKISVVK
ncbi:MAG: immunoglobulin-like domain-containing protein [Bacteroidota bacterium]